jgi:hypothetical protein
VVAGFEGDHGGAAARPLTGLGQGDDLGVRTAGVRVEPLADHAAVRAQQDAADHRIGARGAETPGG